MNKIEVGTKFVGNINKMYFEVVKIEGSLAIVKELSSNKKFNYGLKALEHCNITVI